MVDHTVAEGCCRDHTRLRVRDHESAIGTWTVEATAQLIAHVEQLTFKGIVKGSHVDAASIAAQPADR
jgi:hypothetical protein